MSKQKTLTVTYFPFFSGNKFVDVFSRLKNSTKVITPQHYFAHVNTDLMVDWEDLKFL